jgi:AcrR family transcriptional regulator
VPARRHPDLRESLLTAVGTLLREKGIEGLSLREVARRAGASPAAPAYHFGTRAGMLTAFAVRGFDGLTDAVTAEVAASAPRSAPERLAALGRGYVAFAIADPGRWEVMFRTELLDTADPALEAALARPRALLLEAVRGCAEAGLIPAAEVETAAIAAWSLTHGLAALWSAGRLGAPWGRPEVDRLAHQVTELFVAGVMRKR